MGNITEWPGLGYIWREQGRHKTETTGGNSLHPTQQWMEPNDGVRSREQDLMLRLCTQSSIAWMANLLDLLKSIFELLNFKLFIEVLCL